jgi:hypothetical protein
MANPYDFLNDYLSKVTDDAGKADPNTDMEDENDFYNTVPDEPQPDEDIDYGLSSDDDQQPQDDEDDDSLMGDDDDEGAYSGPINNAPPSVSADDNGTRNRIAGSESQGKYSAYNPRGGGGGAVGKYQFRWNIWQDSIKKVTGVKSKDEFLKSPQAQEKYFGWYQKHFLKPAAEKLQQFNTAGLSMDQLERLVHFRGEGGAKKYLQGKLKDKPESYNMPISKYIAAHQTGGSSFYMNPTTRFQIGGHAMAVSPGAQSQGLNNPSFSEMTFPMEGVNTFRGLDDGEPVYLEDETGKKAVLKGRHHRTRMTGKVYEKRLK